METVTYADGTTEQWQYDDFRQVSWYKDRSGVRLQTVRDPFDGTVMLQQYVDAAGNVLRVVAEYEYYLPGTGRLPRGLVKTITAPTGDPNRPTTVTKYEYYESGKLTGLVQSIYHDYDDAAGTYAAKEEFTYDRYGHLESHRDADGIWHWFEHDRNGLLLKELIGPKNAQILTAKYVYDAAGNLVSVTTPGSATDPTVTRTTKYGYDAFNRVQYVQEPATVGAAYTYYDYTADGLVERMWDPLGRETQYVYDARRQLKEVRQTVDGTFDAEGNALSGLQKTAGYVYDGEGNLLSESGPLAGQTTYYTYDADGNPLRTQSPDPDGAGPLLAAVTTTTFDRTARTRTETRPNPAGGAALETVYQYDATGRLEFITGPLGSRTDYAYYADDSLKSETKRLAGIEYAQTAYEYDVFGRLQKTTVTAAAALTATTRVETRYEIHWGNTVRIEDHYDALDNKTVYEYDVYGRLAYITRPDPDGIGQPLQSPVIVYEYYRDGQVKT